MASTAQFALSQLWASLSGSASSRLNQINAMMVAGPNVDVGISSVAGYLLLHGIYPTIATFAQGAATGDPTHDGALVAAKTFMAWLTIPGAPEVHMSQPDVFAEVNAMGNAMVAQETASPGSTGVTQDILTGLLALCQTEVPWWQANGLSAPITMADIASAGLILG